MKLISSGSIRTNLSLVVLVAVLPILAVILASGVERREAEVEAVKVTAHRLVESFAAQQESVTHGVRQLLTTLLLLPEVQQLDAQACSRIFMELVRQNPLYANFTLLSPEGVVMASAVPYTNANYADQKQVQDALRTREFAVGKYNIGRISALPTIAFALPVLDAKNRLTGVLNTGLNLNQYPLLFQEAQLPEGSIFSILDHKGERLLFHPPSEQNPLGASILRAVWAKYSGDAMEGLSFHQGSDGVRRFYLYRQLRLKPDASPYMVVTVAIPEAYALAQADAVTMKYLLWLSLAASLSLASAWLVGRLGIIDPISRLASAANCLEKGDLAVQTGLAGMNGHLGELARAFDAMALATRNREEERDKAEERLRESEEKIRTVADHSYDWEYWRDAEGRLIWVSPSCTRLTGYTPEEFMADPGLLPRILPPENTTLFNCHIHEVDTGTTEPCEMDICIMHRSGQPVWFSHCCAPVFSSDGTPLGRRVSNRDITARRHAEAALRESEERFSRAFEYAPIGMALVAPDGRWLKVNQSLCDLVGYSSAEMLTKTFQDITHPDDLNADLEFVRQMLTGEIATYQMEKRYFSKSGEVVWVLLSVSLVRDHQGNALHFISQIQDITARRDTEKALVETREKALLASQAKSDFLANMSHEIRTPISTIIGTTAMVLDSPLPEDVRENVQAVRYAASSLLQIINDILDLSKIEAQKLTLSAENFDLHDILQRSVRVFAAEARRRGLDLKLQFSADCPRAVCGDPGRLNQVITNLVGNALKFTLRGRVAVEARRAEPSGPGIKLLFAVSDTGIGIAQNDHDKLFRGFSQVDSSYAKRFRGTGLGLAISMRLVEMMGGTIWVESELRKGSTFFFTVTFGQPDSAVQPRTRARTAAPESTRPLRVLVVEDNEAGQKYLTYFLTEAGHTAVTVGSGQEALEILAREAFDCVLMDVNMPGMDGIETTRRIRASTSGRFDPDLPVAALTAYAMQGDRDRCLAAGMDDYLAKPVEREALLDAVARMVERKNRLRPPEREAAEPSGAPAGDMGESPFDREKLTRSYRKEFLVELLSLVLSAVGPRMDELRQGLDAGDLDLAVSSAHSLVGSMSTIQAHPALRLAREIQEHARNRDLDRARECFPHLETEMERLTAALRGCLADPGPVRDVGSSTEGFSRREGVQNRPR